MRLLALLEDPEGPSARLRLFAFQEALNRGQVELTAVGIPPSGAARRRLLNSAAQYDVVLVQRRLLPPWQVARLRRASRRLVYDFDDALLYRDHEPFPSLARRVKWRAWLRAADQVICGSTALAELVRQHGGTALCIPTTVEPVAAGDVPVSGPLVWIGQAATSRYLAELLPWIEDFCRDRALRVAAVGAAAVEADFVDQIPWSPEAERAALASARVGLAPLPQDPWAEGKCAVRVLRALSAGRPVVASPVGAQEELGRTCDAVLLARDPSKWREALGQLLDASPGRTAELAAAARRCHAEHAPDAWEARWLAAVLGDSADPGVAGPAAGR